MNFLLAWAVSLVYIGAKSYQQRVVMRAQYHKMPPMSYLMAFCEVFVTTAIVRSLHSTWELTMLAFAIGTGAWMGSMLGTYLHARGRQ